jgi:hypothetical protein
MPTKHIGKLMIKNMAIMENFVITSDKFNLSRICTCTFFTIIIIITTTTTTTTTTTIIM